VTHGSSTWKGICMYFWLGLFRLRFSVFVRVGVCSSIEGCGEFVSNGPVC
jgi:hypothetical protein